MWSLVNELSEPGKYFNTPIIGKCTRMFKSSSAMKVGLSRVCIVFLVFFPHAVIRKYIRREWPSTLFG